MVMTWQFVSAARKRLSREQGTIFKDWGGKLPIALVYPNSYHVGMSNLGFQTVYALFNQDERVVCERAFWDERARDILDRSPFSLESQRELREFAVIAFSVTFELDYFNAVSALRSAGLPLLAAERDERHPLVIGGGPAITGNPEPIAPFLDAVAIGEAEVIAPRLVEVLKAGTEWERPDFLRRLAEVPGIYVPSLYEVAYGTDGAVEAITPVEDALLATFPVARQLVRNLREHPVHSAVLTPDTELGDMYLIEISRGCARGCKFCLAGSIFRPVRKQAMDVIETEALEGLKYRQRLGLVAAATTDYPRIGELAARLRRMGARIAVSSLRMDSITDELLQALAESDSHTVTFAPEAGSERLRSIISKGLSNEQILRAVEMAAQWGFKGLKLYYLIGLPTETDEDVQAIVDLTLEIKSVIGRHQRKSHITVNLSPFVPKAQTPFQHEPMAEVGVIERRIRTVQDALRQHGVTVRHESAAWSEIQGVLARGDRRLSEVLGKVSKTSLHEWKNVMGKCGLDPDFYLRRQRRKGEINPWSGVEGAQSDKVRSRAVDLLPV